MCLPAAALPIAAAAMSAASSLAGGYSQLQQSKYEAGVDKQNAQLAREAAAESIRTGEKERRDFFRKVGSVKGQQSASMAANGIDVGYGTAEHIREDTQNLANEDASTLYGNIHNRTRGYIIEASNHTMAAKAAKARGRAAMIGSVFEAGTSLLSGFEKSGAIKAKAKVVA